MKTEFKFQEGLKDLIKTKTIDEINVISLCDYIHSNRQTFYYHYRDIVDVIEATLLAERVDYSKKIYDIESANKHIVAYINSNYSYLRAIAGSSASNVLVDFFYRYYTNVLLSITNDKKQDTTINRYLCNLYSNELLNWIQTKRKESQISLFKRFEVIWEYFTNKYKVDVRK